jgi:hypothetical protein
MTTPPDFSSGQVLTSSAMNSVGLWLVKTQTVGTAVSSVAVTGAFSTDYEHYKIQYSGTASTSGNCINIQLGAVTTGYYAVLQYGSYAGVGGSVVADSNAASWTHCAGAVGNQVILDADIYNPFKTQISSISTNIYTDSNNAGKKAGYLNSATQFTGFTLLVASGTITGGTIRVYGYRN